MTNETGPGGYSYGDALALPDHLQNEEIFNRPYWELSKHNLAGSFVVSGGRQGNQLCDQVALAMLHEIEGGGPDFEIHESELVTEAIRNWQLPNAHTKAPYNTPGQVAGVFHFWWLAQGDAAKFVHTPDRALPSYEELEDRYEYTCQVPPMTSSTNAEEMAVIKEAFSSINVDNEAIAGGIDGFIMRHCLPAHINGVQHWSNYRRPRPGADKHLNLWRHCIEYAADRPEDERTLYDRLLIRHGQVLEAALSMEPEDVAWQGLARLQRKHDQAVAMYNHSHPNDRPLTTLIDGIELPESSDELAGSLA